MSRYDTLSLSELSLELEKRGLSPRAELLEKLVADDKAKEGAGAGSAAAAAAAAAPPRLVRQTSTMGKSEVSHVQTALHEAGLKTSQLVLHIDCTKSNEILGKNSFGGRSLHDVSLPTKPNPYQQVISIIGRTLAPFDSDGFIPCFGFGDQHTTDKAVFAMFDEKANPKGDCGFDAVLASYEAHIPKVALSGPMSFGASIRKTMALVKATKPMEFTICLILCDGEPNNKEDTVKAIIEASSMPIAIVCVGLGDGPWKAMYEFDDGTMARKFDNFNFVCFNDVVAKAKEAGLSIAAALSKACLEEIPKAVRRVRAKRPSLLPSSPTSPTPPPPPLTPVRRVRQAQPLQEVVKRAMMKPSAKPRIPASLRSDLPPMAPPHCQWQWLQCRQVSAQALLSRWGKSLLGPPLVLFVIRFA